MMDGVDDQRRHNTGGATHERKGFEEVDGKTGHADIVADEDDKCEEVEDGDEGEINAEVEEAESRAARGDDCSGQQRQSCYQKHWKAITRDAVCYWR